MNSHKYGHGPVNNLHILFSESGFNDIFLLGLRYKIS